MREVNSSLSRRDFTPFESRERLEMYARPLVKFAWEVDRYTMDWALVEIFGQPVFVWHLLSKAKLRKLIAVCHDMGIYHLPPSESS